MTLNVGGFDRIFRIVLGVILVIAGFFFISGTVGTIVGIIGLIPLVTGVVGWCPLYLPFKFNTHKS